MDEELVSTFQQAHQLTFMSVLAHLLRQILVRGYTDRTQWVSIWRAAPEAWGDAAAAVVGAHLCFVSLYMGSACRALNLVKEEALGETLRVSSDAEQSNALIVKT
eukprot:1158139-Pelagomonas_calceolata.AAC.5